MLGDDYRGLVGSFPYAARHSESWLFRAYAVLSALVALFVAVALTLSLVTLIASTASLRGGSTTLSRAFFGVVGLLILFPLVAPVLAVARRHRRREAPPSSRHDAAFALAGFLFVCSLYGTLLASIPADLRDPASAAGALEPLIAALYAAPPLTGLAFPAAAALLIAALWFRTR